MKLEPTSYYLSNLATIRQQLIANAVAQKYLSGKDIRLDGTILSPDDPIEFPFAILSTLEMAHLFSIFNGSRVHQQAEKFKGQDDAPPGIYFTVINPKVIASGHKNRSGIFREEMDAAGLFIDGLHIDHFFIGKNMTRSMLGAISFTLCAITGHLAGLTKISLIAAGGRGFNSKHVGFKVWPKFGFDANLIDGETDGVEHLSDCCTVQDVIERDSDWWSANGSQRLMTFDLSANSASWGKLLDYIKSRFVLGALIC